VPAVYLTEFLWMWVCRLIGTLVAYMYHDWFAIIPMLWVIWTFVPEQPGLHKATKVFFMPALLLIYALYYFINVNGLIDLSNVE
jgi:hypothetical protein